MSLSFYNSLKEDWRELLLPQKGSGAIAYWSGVRPQRGGSVGGILRSIMRFVPSFFNSPVGRQLTDSGKQVIQDISKGAAIGEALKTEGKKMVQKLSE